MYLEREFLLELREILLHTANRTYVEDSKETELYDFVYDFLEAKIDEAIDAYLEEYL